MATMNQVSHLQLGDVFYMGSVRYLVDRVQMNGQHRIWAENPSRGRFGFLLTQAFCQRVTRIVPADRVRAGIPKAEKASMGQLIVMPLRPLEHKGNRTVHTQRRA